MTDTAKTLTGPFEHTCPRCGDMFYHPKTVIEDYKQRAQEWEEQCKKAESELTTLRKAKDENDERFMIERDQARQEVKTLRKQVEGMKSVLKEAADYLEISLAQKAVGAVNSISTGSILHEKIRAAALEQYAKGSK